MSEKLQGCSPIGGMLRVPVFGFVLLLSIFLANCRPARVARVNWLDSPESHPGWDSVILKCDPNDPRAIALEIKKIRAYVRGWAVEYNMEHGKHYKVIEFNFIEKSRSPLMYAFTAYLRPGAKHVTETGGHLIPSEPPPPK